MAPPAELLQKENDEFLRGDLTLNENETLMFKSASLCPECLKLIPMLVFERDGKAMLRKVCKEHGMIEDVYWADAKLLEKAKKYEVKGRGLVNPHNEKEHPVCPQDCGLCSIHETHSGLTNLVITNRCDLTCWYCFFYAEAAGYIYEPSLDEIRNMIRLVTQEKPIKGNAIQLTGGNPELREDLPEIIKICKEEGIDHIQINTNATHRLHNDAQFAKNIREAGANTVYLSFDGVTPRTNPKNHWEVPGVLKNLREANLGAVLVPTLINTVNDHEIGDILKFGFKHNDIIRGVNYQPVSLVGRMPRKDREKFRITIPDVIQRLDEHTGGQITYDDFYPVPCTVIFSEFMEILKGHPKYELSINPACGMATYVFRDGDRMIPITRFVDVEGLFEYLKEKTEEMRNGASKHWILAKMLVKLNSFVMKEKQPSWLNLSSVLHNIFLKGNYSALGEFHKNSLFVGMMHFQDLYNWDIQRIKKCDIHYTTPDGVIPFCTFNVIPQWYRDKIQRRHSITIQEWEAKTGKTLKDGYYKRDIKALEAMPNYMETYGGFVKPKTAITVAPAQAVGATRTGQAVIQALGTCATDSSKPGCGCGGSSGKNSCCSA